MAYYAKIENNAVTRIVIRNEDPTPILGGTWVETRDDGSIRANFAGIGYTYDSSNDVFYEARPYASWSLDSNYRWQPPVAYPSDGNTNFYSWNETNREWDRM